MIAAFRTQLLHSKPAPLASRLRVRTSPYFVKVAKGLRLGYYRGPKRGTWIGSRYRDDGIYDTRLARRRRRLTSTPTASTSSTSGRRRRRRAKWSERQSSIDEGLMRRGPYTVADAVRDYLEDVRAEKKPEAVRGAERPSTRSCCRSSATSCVDEIDVRSAHPLAQRYRAQPRRVRTRKRVEQAYDPAEHDDDARRRRKASVNRILACSKRAQPRVRGESGRVGFGLAQRQAVPEGRTRPSFAS